MTARKQQDNLGIWESVNQTPTTAIKAADVEGMKIMSIDQMYVIRRATEIFGPMGIGWGFDIVDERFDQGAPIFAPKPSAPEHYVQSDGQASLPRQPAPDVVMAYEITHTIRLVLWFKWNGEKGTVTQFGHTKYIYRTNGGKWKTDGEAPKKSVSDAIKKCLSLLGFAADVYEGKFDDKDYLALRQSETFLATAENADEEIKKLQDEYAEWIKKQCGMIEFGIPHPASVQKAADAALNRVNARASLARVDANKGVGMIRSAAERGVERLYNEREEKKAEARQKADDQKQALRADKAAKKDEAAPPTEGEEKSDD
jgi:hypothetical protein